MRDEALADEKNRQKEKFNKDFDQEPLVTSQPRIAPEHDIFIQNAAIGGESSEDEEEQRLGERELGDEIDLKQFKEVLKAQKIRQVSKAKNVLS